MQVIENLKVKEKVYIEKLENGLTVMIIPKKGIQKKYMIWGTNYGSNESSFIVPGEESHACRRKNFYTGKYGLNSHKFIHSFMHTHSKISI